MIQEQQKYRIKICLTKKNLKYTHKFFNKIKQFNNFSSSLQYASFILYLNALSCSGAGFGCLGYTVCLYFHSIYS